MLKQRYAKNTYGPKVGDSLTWEPYLGKSLLAQKLELGALAWRLGSGNLRTLSSGNFSLEALAWELYLGRMTAGQGTPNRGNRGKSINLIQFDIFYFLQKWSWGPLDRLKILS